MQRILYICPGSCKGVATEEKWQAGAKTCGAANCERHGMPLEKRLVCEKCGAQYKSGETRHCSSAN